MRNGKSLFLWGIVLFTLNLIAGTLAVRDMLSKAGGRAGRQAVFFEASLLMIPLLLVAVGAYVFFVKYLRYPREEGEKKNRLLVACSLIGILALTLMIAVYLLLLAVGLFT